MVQTITVTTTIVRWECDVAGCGEVACQANPSTAARVAGPDGWRRVDGGRVQCAVHDGRAGD